MSSTGELPVVRDGRSGAELLPVEYDPGWKYIHWTEQEQSQDLWPKAATTTASEIQ